MWLLILSQRDVRHAIRLLRCPVTSPLDHECPLNHEGRERRGEERVFADRVLIVLSSGPTLLGKSQVQGPPCRSREKGEKKRPVQIDLPCVESWKKGARVKMRFAVSGRREGRKRREGEGQSVEDFALAFSTMQREREERVTKSPLTIRSPCLRRRGGEKKERGEGGR